MIKAVIFDFDGVISESVAIKTRAFARLFEPEGERVVKDVVDFHRAHRGVSRYEKFVYFYKSILKRDLTDKVFQMLCRSFSQLVVDEVVQASYVKGTREFLENGAKNYQCFISSATPQEEIEDIIQKKDLQKFFINIYGAPEKKESIVKNILFEYGIKPHEAVCIGDGMSDYEAARKNGVHFIGRVENEDSRLNEVSGCIKIKDLTGINKRLKDIERT